MSNKIVFAGGEVIDAGGRRREDVAIDSATGEVTDTGIGIDSTEAEIIDISGKVIAPGLVDLHAHLRQPGNEEAETVASAADAAVAGGYTAILAMPDTEPCADSAGAISDLLSLAQGLPCEVVPAGAISIGRKGERLAPIAEMVELGVRLFTDNAPGVQDANFMRRAMEYLCSIESPDGQRLSVAQHAEVSALAGHGVMHEGSVSSRLGLPGKPAEAEEIQVMRDIALARLTGVRMHLQHITTAGSVAMIRAAKAGGVPVTATVSPYHLAFTDHNCAGFDPKFRVDPPLRTAADITALKAGIADGTIDAISSGHAPSTPDGKEQPFDMASVGSIGLETTLAVAMTELDLPLEDVLAALSWKPAQLVGLHPRHGGPITEGADANLVVIDPEAAWTPTAISTVSRSKNSIFEGRALKGRVIHTVYGGRIVMRNSAKTELHKSATQESATQRSEGALA